MTSHTLVWSVQMRAEYICIIQSWHDCDILVASNGSWILLMKKIRLCLQWLSLRKYPSIHILVASNGDFSTKFKGE